MYICNWSYVTIAGFVTKPKANQVVLLSEQRVHDVGLVRCFGHIYIGRVESHRQSTLG